MWRPEDGGWRARAYEVAVRGAVPALLSSPGELNPLAETGRARGMRLKSAGSYVLLLGNYLGDRHADRDCGVV